MFSDLSRRVSDGWSSGKSEISNSIDSLKGSPPDLWAAYWLKFLESYGYFAFSQILVIFLHDEFDLKDVEAGMIYGLCGAAITGWGLLLSFLNDSLGVRNSMLIGFTLSTISRICLALTTNIRFALVVLFIFLPISTSLGIPMLTIGLKRYTNSSNRGFAFGLFYSVMNVAAFVSGPVVDICNISLKGMTISGRYFSGNRLVFFTCALSSVIAFLVTYFCIRDIKVDDSASLQQYSPQKVPVCTTIKDFMHSRTFWRFCAFTLILVNLNAIFRHLDATFPTYLIRMFGRGIPKGTIYGINPFMIIFLTPLVAALTRTSDHFNMIHVGGYVSALSPFIMVLSSSIWSSCVFVIILSFGESMWGPRLYDYTMSISPDGKEATFSALATAPLFAAKIPVGLMSGWLLSTYCPEDGRKRPRIMWLIIGLLTISSPILITLFQKYLREPKSEVNKPQGDEEEEELEMIETDDEKIDFKLSIRSKWQKISDDESE